MTWNRAAAAVRCHDRHGRLAAENGASLVSRMAKTQRKSIKAEASLSRERIAATALELLDEEGLDAFSVRKLAARLEVGPASLYVYYRGKDEILHGVVDLVLSELDVADAADDWQVQAGSTLRSLRRLLLAHPAVIRILGGREVMTPNSLRMVEHSLEALREAGHTGPDAVRAYGILLTYTLGFAIYEVPRQAYDPSRPERVINDRIWIASQALNPSLFPNLVELGAPMANLATDEQFEFGLSVILSGLQDQVASLRG